MRISWEEREEIRRVYYVERKSQREIAKESGRSREAIKQVIEEGREGVKREQKVKKEMLLYEPYRARVEELLEERGGLPRKQRYTSSKIYELISHEGYEGCESRVRQEVGKWRAKKKPQEVYVPLEFEPGQDAQCDWGEALVVIDREEVKVQVYVLRMCYSRRLFVMAFPSQKRECFLSGHIHAFAYFGGVPHRISYDNVPTAVKVTYNLEEGKRELKREENQAFIAFRSYYLFESHFCTPGQPHEKGGVENAVGYSRRDRHHPEFCVKRRLFKEVILR